MSRPTIVILKTGDNLPAAKAACGDFDALFVRALGGDPGRFRILEPAKGALLPPVVGIAGILVTGSSASLLEDPGWMGEAGGWILGAAQMGVPVLGVCFGHQLLADAFGGEVARAAKGREAGTVEVQLGAAGLRDPLFAGLPERLLVQEAHGDEVRVLPEGAELLAGNDHCAVQAFKIGDHVRGVQFHPEFDAELSRFYVEARTERIREAAALRGEAPDAALARVREGVRESEHGMQILANWRRHFVDCA